ncbi:MAG: hypothetical protein KC415_16840, partial [Anaerolineales bacterium]|nr:hypothetical protein [Anaerolineales bacterium]
MQRSRLFVVGMMLTMVLGVVACNTAVPTQPTPTLIAVALLPSISATETAVPTPTHTPTPDYTPPPRPPPPT